MTRARRMMLWGAGIGAATLLVRAGLRARRRIDFAGRVVLITGGSRGLGLALARRFAAEGARLALVARDQEELDTAAAELRADGADVLTLACDVGSRYEVRDAVREAVGHYGRIDVLVNVAGVMEVGPHETMRTDDFRESMRVHAWGPLYAIRAALPSMRREGEGRIVNIISIGGKIALPHMAPYSMSKFALAGLSDSMRAELARHGIRVTSVFPGLMRTGSHVQAVFKGRPEREFAWFATLAGSPLTSTTADAAARRIVEACRYGDPQLVITLPAKAAVAAQAIAPGLVAALMSFVGRLLPRATPVGLIETRAGWHSRGGRVQSWLTAPADRAILTHNQRLRAWD